MGKRWRIIAGVLVGLAVGVAALVISRRPSETPILTSEQLKENFVRDKNGVLTIEGLLEGKWLRLRSGGTLGDSSKATIVDPLRLTIGSRSLPLVGMTDDVEQMLLKNSGKKVRLSDALLKLVRLRRGTASARM